jgi:hypothetical protein
MKSSFNLFSLFLLIYSLTRLPAEASLFGSSQHAGLYYDIPFSLSLRHADSTVGSGAIWYRTESWC